MSAPKGYIRNFLDRKEIFYQYFVEMGKGSSFPKIQRNLWKRGIYNELTGKPFSTSAIYQAVWTYAFTHWEEAEPIIRKYYLDFGIIVPDDLWKMKMAHKINRYLTKRVRGEFYKKHPEYDVEKPKKL